MNQIKISGISFYEEHLTLHFSNGWYLKYNGEKYTEIRFNETIVYLPQIEKEKLEKLFQLGKDILQNNQMKLNFSLS